MARHRRAKRDLIQDNNKLGDASRNERQKSVLLAALGEMRRQEVGGVIESTKEIVEKSKKLCARETARAAEKREGKRRA